MMSEKYVRRSNNESQFKKIYKGDIYIFANVLFFLGCGKFKPNSTGIKLIDDILSIKPSDKEMQLVWSFWLSTQNSYQGTGTVSMNIGPTGGTLKDSSGNYELEIPAGTLTTDQTIKMTVLNSETIGVHSPITPKIMLEPHGLQFQKPVKLKLKYGKENTSQFAKDLASIYNIKENKQLEKILTTRSLDGEYLIAELNHFSLYSGLYLRIEDVVVDIITNPLDIRNIVDEFRVYLNGWGSVA